LLWKVITMTTLVQPRKINDFASESSLRFPDNPLPWNSAKGNEHRSRAVTLRTTHAAKQCNFASKSDSEDLSSLEAGRLSLTINTRFQSKVTTW
jgi:hypothetical protein